MRMYDIVEDVGTLSEFLYSQMISNNSKVVLLSECRDIFISIQRKSKYSVSVCKQQFLSTALRNYRISYFIMNGAKNTMGCRYVYNILTNSADAVSIFSKNSLQVLSEHLFLENDNSMTVVYIENRYGELYFILGSYKIKISYKQFKKIYTHKENPLTISFFIVDA